MDKCTVYIIHSTSGHYKIGISRDMNRRLRQLQRTQGPYEYRLVGGIVCDSVEVAREMEADLHAEFDDKRVRGEWFELGEMDVILIGLVVHRTITKDTLKEAKMEAYRHGIEIGKVMAEYAELPY